VLVPPHGTALDVATGGGHTALWLAGHGWKVTAGDIAPRMLENAKKLCAGLQRVIKSLTMFERLGGARLRVSVELFWHRGDVHRKFMKAIQGYHLVEPKDLFWRPSNLMQIPNAEYLERTGSENIGARLWRFHKPPCVQCPPLDRFGMPRLAFAATSMAFCIQGSSCARSSITSAGTS
jgi:hypothetical protein